MRRSVLPDSKADLLVYGNAQRAVVELSHRLAAGEAVKEIDDIRGTALMRQSIPEGWLEIDSTQLDEPGRLEPHTDPYATNAACGRARDNAAKVLTFHRRPKAGDRSRSVVRLPSYDQVSRDPTSYAHASRVFHLETNPGNARALVQRHGKRELWLNPPPTPLCTRDLDRIYEFPYTRRPHPG